VSSRVADLIPRADPFPPCVKRVPVDTRRADEQRDVGRSVRASIPRTELGDWYPARDRPDPIAMIVEQNRSRTPELVPIRHGRMLASPLSFFRGAAVVMAADLARMPSTGLYVQACGDAHLSNFGAFATPERRIAFDLNDFDETHPAPFEWDVMRLAASIVIASRTLGLPLNKARRLANVAVSAYRTRMLELADLPFLDVWYAKIDLSEIGLEEQQEGTPSQRRRATRWLRKVRQQSNAQALARMATLTPQGWRLRDDPPLIVRRNVGKRSRGVIRQAMAAYGNSLGRSFSPILRHYEFADVARYVVGVASVGRACFVMLFVGARDDDAVLLQLKEAPASVLEPYTETSSFAGQGERVVTGQRLMQAASDPLLGWLRVDGLQHSLDYYVRQLRDWKGSFELETSPESRLVRYAGLCGYTLAQAHARSGAAPVIAGYLGRGPASDAALTRFAMLYADQNDRDYAAFRQAELDGRIGAHDVT
jgi:uncharacterized protein (DUF2252 family)